MNKKSTLAIIFLVVILSTINTFGFSLYDLTCDNEQNPVGIEGKTPSFSWKTHSDQRGFKQSAYQILVADNLIDLSANYGNLWDSDKQSSHQSLGIPYEGAALEPATKYYWKVRAWDSKGNASAWSLPQYFTTALFSDEDWSAAQWIALEADRPDERVVPGCHLEWEATQRLGDKKTGMYVLPQFRKAININKPVKEAIAFVTGLGHFDFYVNGSKVGNHFLDAAWSNYDRLAYYVAFDITNLLNQGENVMGMMLGNGFYNIPRERYFKLLTNFGTPKMRMIAKIVYDDGTVDEIVSDQSWRVSKSPITYSSIYGGEDYDARLKMDGWMLPGYDDSNWQKPVKTNCPARMAVQRTTPLTIHSEIPTQRVFKNKSGNWVYDLGQNFSGIVRIKVKSDGPKTIIMRTGELLNPDSTVNQSASGEPFYLQYTTQGDGNVEEWQPQFTYYGLRYVQVEGAAPENEESDAQIIELTGLHTCNSAKRVGEFSCSKPMFNKIYTLIDWALRSNMASVFTDCPHREKLGWLEETHLMQYSLLYNYDLLRQFHKIMEDMSLSQREDGCIPSICPEYVRFNSGFEDSPEWGSAFIICPWHLYKWYGDISLIEKYYPAMKQYLAYLDSKADSDGIVAYGLGDWFDIGPGTPGYSQLTDQGVTATAMYYYNSYLMYQMADVLGKKEDADIYANKAMNIKHGFNDRYWHADTQTLDRNSQTANAIALYFNLIDEDKRPTVVANLIQDIKGRGNALTAGDIGYRYVLRALERNGHSDVIFDMNSRYDVPGYGWQLAHGATALTESWQAYGFVSNNHFMLGHLMEWFYSGLGGISQTDSSVAFSDIVIHPQIVGDVRYAKTSFESPYGQIISDWAISNDNKFSIKVSIPANTTAQVILPVNNIDLVSDYGIPLAQCKDLETDLQSENLVVKVPSGNYYFECK